MLLFLFPKLDVLEDSVAKNDQIDSSQDVVCDHENGLLIAETVRLQQHERLAYPKLK
jgi:hypothetical protein